MKTIKKISLVIAAVVYINSTANAQLTVKPNSGNVKVGSEIAGSDANNIVALNIFGKTGTMKAEAKLAFGDFGTSATGSWNVFVGEYGIGDSDQLWLHGKNGIYLTYGGTANTVIGRYNVSEGNKFSFNCDVWSSGVKLTSDARFKTNVKKIENSLDLLKKLNGVRYNLLPKEPVKFSESNGQKSASANTGTPSEKEQKDMAAFKTLEKKLNETEPLRIGFIAQELQKVFPELVEADTKGFLAVDYIGIIPVLVEAIKEQQIIIDTQDEKMKALENRLKTVENSTTSINDLKDNSSTLLEQNSPNPFSQSTQIRYTIPANATGGSVLIFDMQGKLIKTYSISETGSGSLTINASELTPGMYIYSLVIDDIEVATKRMILTSK